MRLLRRLSTLAVPALALAVLLSSSTTAAGAGHRGKGHGSVITGRLSKAGYTVIALGYDGKALTARGRSFRFVSPDPRGVTLQLRNAHGKYAGPVVVAGGGRRVVEGVKPGAKLGLIRIRNGYAKVAHPLKKRFVDRRRWAQARKGVPIGNGRNFGLVRSKIHNGPSGRGGDTSRTGVPNAFSIDRNGNGRIDALERGGKGGQARKAAAVGFAPPPGFSFFSQIFLDLGSTLNADASGVTQAQIDAMLPHYLNIVGVDVPPGDQVALDCGGLSYCSAGGTGVLQTDQGAQGEGSSGSPFPSCCDPSGDGFGNLRGPDAVGLDAAGNANDWGFLYPNATSSQIGSGDAFVLRVTSGGTLTQIPETLAFVFNTVPALDTYDDGAGDSGTISYPVPDGAPGTQGNPIPVKANGSGDVVFSMKFWRPQRRGIPGAGEPDFMDIGQLGYTVDAVSLANGAIQAATGRPPAPNAGSAASVCSAASLSTTDPNLTLQGSGSSFGDLVDGAHDQPASSANLLGFSVDLTKCLADAGISSFPVGSAGAIGLKADAPNSSDHAVQNIWVERVS